PYTPSIVTILAVHATDDSPEVLEQTTIKTILNMSSENKAHYELKKEAIHFLLTGIGDEIYLTVDACKTTHEMLIAIERLQQESMKSYYSRFYKMMNEMKRNNLIVDAMQVNVQFLQQLQPRMVKQVDWLADMDEEIDEQELEAHYSYMAKIQEVPIADSKTNTEPLEQVQYDAEFNVFANERQHSEQPESISNTCVMEKVDSNVIPDSLDMCDNDIHTDQNAVECDDEHVALANLNANLKLDVDENKKI
nr:hypothetical protein [Tanacetum cinerariifolium]